jgi:hypothetical protein
MSTEPGDSEGIPITMEMIKAGQKRADEDMRRRQKVFLQRPIEELLHERVAKDKRLKELRQIFESARIDREYKK